MKARLLFLNLLLLPLVAIAQRAPIGIVSGQGTLHGLQIGVISSIDYDGGRGVQLSGISNMSATSFRGIQLSGISNITQGVERGVQLSGLINVSSEYMRGLQFATVNYADSLNGSQLGLLNIAHAHPRGWQVGLVNITHDTLTHKIGLVNINALTDIDYMLFGGTSNKINLAVRFRNHSTYNIIGFGTHYMGLSDRFSGSLYYRLGKFFRATPKLTLSGDIGYYHVETFEQHNDDKPERLFSLQAHLNADYQLNDRLGMYASVGWCDTRYYHHARNYRSRPLFELGVTLRQNRNYRNKWYDSYVEQKESTTEASDDMMALLPQKKHPWLAAAGVVGINVGVHLFDRYASNEEFAQTTLRSIRKNFKTGFVWDNDKFVTNMFAHPYHGNLYFNTARTNGLSFWESAPYALGGSLMWEFFGETEPPAINDIFATTFGGIAIGEMTHRISHIVLNDRQRGFRRFLREAAATIINPIQGLHRIISGDAWRVRPDHYKYHDHDATPIYFSMTTGLRYLADDGAMFRGEHSPYVNLYLAYGTAVDGERHTTPYDFFDMDVTFIFSGNQSLVNSVNIIGRLWSTPILDQKDMAGEFGIYQHFNYFDSRPIKDGSDLTPYRISEAAAVGPGFIFSLPKVGALSGLEQRVFLSGILLGGTKSDYFNVIERDYNMGSGFSLKSKTHLEFPSARLILHAKYFNIFTWKGYESRDLSKIDDLHYLNVQGDKGNAALLVVNPIIEVDLKGPWCLNFSGSYFYRKTHYKSYDDIIARTFEAKVGLTCHF